MSKKKRRKRKEEVYEDPYPDSDGWFAYIAGYTEGGAPYGVTWEEMGIDPDLPFEEKIRLLEEKDKIKTGTESISDDLPF